ncbi:TetR/AcrR family transcriptional regulator [Salinispirillum marinum]|uniref:TetR/AcrR family transcriptional regulator n=2 Tax=Saccharospirillaceae TaxID=255527 RepID=A0ABV8BFL0_9GAMM
MKLSDQKRMSILRAAERLFCRHGLEQTSMDQVADKANVSKRTVYNHFSTKEALFHAILVQMQASLSETPEVVFDPEQPIEAQLLDIAQQEALLLDSEDFLRLARVAFMHMLQRPELAQQFNTAKFGCMTYLSRFLGHAVAHGVLAIDDIDLAVKQFVSQIKSLIFYPRLYGLEVPDAQQQDYVLQQTVALFLARYQAR